MKGFGRIFMENTIYDGVFEDGYLQGKGIQYRILEKTYILGCFCQNSCQTIISKGEGFPKNLLSTNFFNIFNN
jgi:hypothetical protein